MFVYFNHYIPVKHFTSPKFCLVFCQSCGREDNSQAIDVFNSVREHQFSILRFLIQAARFRLFKNIAASTTWVRFLSASLLSRWLTVFIFATLLLLLYYTQDSTPDSLISIRRLAIAFATGRRMAEIHCQHTQFLLVEGCDDKLLFKGQAKTKGRGELAPYEIITWLSAKIVLDGYRRLVATGKCDYEIVDVNKKLGRAFSTDLPVKIRRMYQRAGISNYKELRDVYGAKIIHYFRDDETRTDNSYIAQYLGHHEYDVNTANTYQKIRLEY